MEKAFLLMRDCTNTHSKGEIPVEPSGNCKNFESHINIPGGEHGLCFTFHGKGKMDFKDFTLY